MVHSCYRHLSWITNVRPMSPLHSILSVVGRPCSMQMQEDTDHHTSPLIHIQQLSCDASPYYSFAASSPCALNVTLSCECNIWLSNCVCSSRMLKQNWPDRIWQNENVNYPTTGNNSSGKLICMFLFMISIEDRSLCLSVSCQTKCNLKKTTILQVGVMVLLAIVIW